MTLTSAEPELYSVDSSGRPALKAVQDRDGYICFPAQSFGSEFNGDHGDELTPITLSGLGTVTATSTVHRHLGHDIAAPFVVASIALDEGPLVRAVLDQDGLATIGERVRAITIGRAPDPSADHAVAELRFTRYDEEHQS